MLFSLYSCSYTIKPKSVYEPVLPTTEDHTAADPTEDKEAVNEDPKKLIPLYTYGTIS